ncbi:MAG: hypothetical protein JNK73_13080 [Bacteroidia bacterium]|nr:hypothetical protein [Bacteroidia bacterium]
MDYRSITSHEAACQIIGKDPAQSTTTSQQSKDIVDAMNFLTKFKPDFNNHQQKKWRPFFIIDQAGFRFHDSCYVDSYSRAFVGSRLCDFVSSEEEADHFGKVFLGLHKRHYYGE